MPLYEYRCHSCGKTIEVIQKFSDQPLSVHADCGGELEKLISRSALQFKGSGWYVTDYGKGGVIPKNPEGKNGDGSSDSKSSDSKSADSKPSDSKSSETRSGTESKSTETKSSDSKPSSSSEPATKAAPVSTTT